MKSKPQLIVGLILLIAIPAMAVETPSHDAVAVCEQMELLIDSAAKARDRGLSEDNVQKAMTQSVNSEFTLPHPGLLEFIHKWTHELYVVPSWEPTNTLGGFSLQSIVFTQECYRDYNKGEFDKTH